MEALRQMSIEILSFSVFIMALLIAWFAKTGINHIKNFSDKIVRRLDISDLKDEARDYALNYLLPQNGDTYHNHKQKRFNQLLEEYNSVNSGIN